MPRRQAFWVGAAVVVAVGILAWRFLQRPESVEAAALRLARCVRSSDAACVASFASTEELQGYGLDRERVRRLLADYVFPPLRGDWAASDPVIEADHPTYMATAILPLSHADGRRTELPLPVAKTEEGLRCPHLVTWLVLGAGALRHVPESSRSVTAGKLAAWSTMVDQDADLLRRLGIRGIYRNPQEGMLDWTRWRDNILSRQKILRRYPSP